MGLKEGTLELLIEGRANITTITDSTFPQIL